MLNILAYDGTTVAQLQPNEVAGWLQQAGARLWLKAINPTTEELAWLKATLALSTPAQGNWPAAAASLNATPRFISGTLPLPDAPPLAFTLGAYFLLTVHQETEALRPQTDLWNLYHQDLSRWPYGLDYLLCQLLGTLMTLPAAASQTTYAALSQPPASSTPWPLAQKAHQLYTWHHFLQQWHSLANQLAHLEHHLLDDNTRHQFQQLQQSLVAQGDEITLWQNWLAQHQHHQQVERFQQTRHSQQRLFWIAAAILLVLIIQLVVLLITN